MPAFPTNPPPGYLELQYDHPELSHGRQRHYVGFAESQYSDDFRLRNRKKVGQIETWLSTFSVLLRQAQRRQDQEIVDGVFEVTRVAASYLDTGLLPTHKGGQEGGGSEVEDGDEDEDEDEEEDQLVPLNPPQDFYRVRHPRAEQEVGLTNEEKLARAKASIEAAKEEFAVRMAAEEAEGEAEAWTDDEGDGSGETTLVDEAMLESVGGLTMDGSACHDTR